MTINAYAVEKLAVHYSRIDSDYEGWTMWVWNEEDKKEGFEIMPSSFDEFGAFFEIDIKKHSLKEKVIGLLPKYKIWEDKEVSEKIVDTKKHSVVYILQGEEKPYFSAPEISTKIISAFFDCENKVSVLFSRAVDIDFIRKSDFHLLFKGNKFYPLITEMSEGNKLSKKAYFVFPLLPDFNWEMINKGKVVLNSEIFKPFILDIGEGVYCEYFTSDKKMGAFVKDGKTYIRIFSPKAVKVYALIYQSPAAEPEVYEMNYISNGLWQLYSDSDLSGKYYRIRIQEHLAFFEGLDPYARCVTAHDGKALITNDMTFVEDGPKFDLSQAIIYEMHIRDFTIDKAAQVKFAGKYLGLSEENTRLSGFPSVKTGLDHLTELGVNIVHILPFQDFENDERSNAYNWGYMPVNFNSPEGYYATETDSDKRVKELKKMIDALHKRNIKVVMDVVYNHTAETKNRHYNFNAMAKDYYYRMDLNGSYYNGSGCGNELKTEAPMTRKFIIDSLIYWVKEYKIDGFRFDLMGLMDRQTAFEIIRKLKAIKPDIIIYGEPWAAGPTPIKGISKGVQRSKGFSLFNDGFRDALKGSVFSAEDMGYVQSGKNKEAVMDGIKGAIDDFTASPLESINYVSCHDNHTLFDKIDLSAENSSLEEKIKMAKLANAIVFTSQGIPFLHSGSEFLRSKKGAENSYNLPDEINMLDWRLKKENAEVFNFYKDLIKLRREHPAFRMKTAEEIRDNLKFYSAKQTGGSPPHGSPLRPATTALAGRPATTASAGRPATGGKNENLPLKDPLIAYILNGENVRDIWEEIVILINPKKTLEEFILPEGEFKIVFDLNGMVNDERKVSSSVEVPAISLMAVVKNKE
ncbi:MAG: type I pullulanase [Elusimicrobia bacterium]|nr:type I pullulanase [Elusimicrobiota bacterium]